MNDIDNLIERLTRAARAIEYRDDYTSRLINAAADALERLQAWKSSALEVLDEWQQVWEAAGRPGTLGGSMAEAVGEWVKERA